MSESVVCGRRALLCEGRWDAAARQPFVLLRFVQTASDTADALAGGTRTAKGIRHKLTILCAFAAQLRSRDVSVERECDLTGVTEAAFSGAVALISTRLH